MITFYVAIRKVDDETSLCSSASSSAVNMTLPASTALRRSVGTAGGVAAEHWRLPAIDQYLLPAGRSAANPPQASHQERGSHQTVHILFLANDRCLRDYDLVVAHC